MIRSLILTGAGSFAGGVSRYLTQFYIQKFFPSSIPYGTLTANVLGCFLIGIIYALAEKGNYLSPEIRILLTAGFCGGYTTFSSFAAENVKLLQEASFFYAGLYILMSLVLGLLAVYFGILLVRLIL